MIIEKQNPPHTQPRRGGIIKFQFAKNSLNQDLQDEWMNRIKRWFPIL
jgi:hypothetical protein